MEEMSHSTTKGLSNGLLFKMVIIKSIVGFLTLLFLFSSLFFCFDTQELYATYMSIQLLDLAQLFLHYGGHFLLPVVIAKIYFPTIRKKIAILMIMTIFVDLDHLLADPVFDPTRCSIWFHPLHSAPAIGIYALMLFVPNTYMRAVAIGLLLHMLVDRVDCLWM